MRTLIFLTLLLVFNSCENNKSNKDLKVFKYNQASEISSLDPAFSKDQATMWACIQLYNGLVQFDNDLNIIPSIAKKWTISEDKKTYQFILRKDVFFHEHSLIDKDRNVVARDFVFSFNRLLDEQVASPGGWVFRGKVKDENPFVAVNDTILEIHLKQPFVPFLGILTLPYCSVVPEEVVNHYGKDFRVNPIGTGPFAFKLWRENEALFLEKNSRYFEVDKKGEALPYLDGIKISFIVDRAAEYEAFVKGDLDFISGIDPAYKDKLLTAQGELQPSHAEKVVLEKSPYLNFEFIGISQGNQTVKALKDKRVRQALNYAIDKNKMIQFLRNNIGVPAANGVIPTIMGAYNPTMTEGYVYNRSKAEKLLADAGYPAGKGIGKISLYTSQNYLELISYIAKAWEEMGLEVEIQNVPAAFQRELMRKNELDIFRASWIADYPHVESYLCLFYSGYGAPPNYTYFKNKEYDLLYNELIQTSEENEMQAITRRMEAIILEEAPVIPLFYDEVLRFYQKNIVGLLNNAMNLLVLKEVQKI
jgi:peptide/nickel transport system substrate-binding protein